MNGSDFDLLRPLLIPELAGLDDEALWEALTTDYGIDPEEIEEVLEFLKNVDWGAAGTGALAGVGPGMALGGAIGTIFPGIGNVVGAAVGGAAGAAVGGIGSAIGSAQRRPKRGRGRRRARRRRGARARPAASRPSPAPATRPAGAGGTGKRALGALLGLLRNPVVVKTIADLVSRASGTASSSGPTPAIAATGDGAGAVAVPAPPSELLSALHFFSQVAAGEALDSEVEDWDLEAYWDEMGIEDLADMESRAWAVIELLDEMVEPSEFDEVAFPERVLPTRGGVDKFRAPVANTRAFPFSSICQLRMTMSRRPGSNFVGTGFYIGPRHILTAGHNLLHQTYGRATSMIATPGRNRNDKPFGSFRVDLRKVVIHPRWAASPTSADFDLALLEVSSPAPNGNYLGLEEMRMSPASGVTVCGYAADRREGVHPDEQNLDVDSVRTVGRESFDYSLHTTGGTSGSPVMYPDGSRWIAVGVHSRGHDDYTNRGCRLTDAKIAWVRSRMSGSRGQPQPVELRASAPLAAAHLYDIEPDEIGPAWGREA